MAEEELLDESQDGEDELRMLNEDNELSIEELRRRYYGDAAVAEAPSNAGGEPSYSQGASGDADKQGYFTDDVLTEEEEDADYVPVAAEYWKKDVRVGPNYQVDLPLPDVNPRPGNAGEMIFSEPLWIPTSLPNKELDQYLLQVAARLHELEDTVPDITPQANRPPKCEGIPDDEDALYALYMEKYNVRSALEKIPFSPSNGPTKTGPNKWVPMTEKEVDIFEEALRECGKNFFKIHNEKMPERTVGELIQFYYTWKKTERHDMYIAANRAQGIAENTKTVDPMDLLADRELGEQNGGVAKDGAAHASHKNWLSVEPHEQSQSDKASS